MVKRLDYNVFIASNGPDLARVTAGLIPNLVILDLDMHLVDGKLALEYIRSNKNLGMIKVLTISDNARLQGLEESLKKGACAYILRPAGPTDLYRTVQAQIEPHPRQVPRIKVVFKATVITGKTGRATYATALSEMGAFIRTLKPLPAGTLCKVSLELPSPKPLVFDAKVLYTVPHDREKMAEPGMGIIFVGLDKDVQAALRKFIEDQITGEGEAS